MPWLGCTIHTELGTCPGYYNSALNNIEIIMVYNTTPYNWNTVQRSRGPEVRSCIPHPTGGTVGNTGTLGFIICNTLNSMFLYHCQLHVCFPHINIHMYIPNTAVYLHIILLLGVLGPRPPFLGPLSFCPCPTSSWSCGGGAHFTTHTCTHTHSLQGTHSIHTGL